MFRTAPSPERPLLTRLFFLLAFLGVSGSGTLLWLVLNPGVAMTEPSPSSGEPVEGISVGRADAPVVIYEFADFQCSGCARFASSIAPAMKERLVERGLVRFVHYDFPLPSHKNAFRASRAARCANEQGGFWKYHDALYARQRDWSASADPTGTFTALAREVGLEPRRFDQCLRSDRYAEDVARSMQFGLTLDVRGTPTLFMNGRKIRVVSIDQLEELVTAEMNSAP